MSDDKEKLIESGDLTFAMCAAFAFAALVAIVAIIQTAGYFKEKTCAEVCGAQGYERVMNSCLCGR